jgi:hypothetical protein
VDGVDWVVPVLANGEPLTFCAGGALGQACLLHAGPVDTSAAEGFVHGGRAKVACEVSSLQVLLLLFFG